MKLRRNDHRRSLVTGWGIGAGASVLEIGCGQGEMTAVLAEAVGPRGRVVAVDIAEPDYGSPMTIGEATAALLAGPLGERIDVRLGFDVLANSFPDDAFDHVVLAQSSWYFASLDQLRHTLVAARSWAPVLCFAEWDLRPDDASQLPHLLAVLIQGQLVTSGLTSGWNVRTPFSREALLRVAESTGWHVDHVRAVDTTGLPDADWEIRACLDLAESSLGERTELAHDLLVSQLDVLRSVAAASGDRPLPAYQLVARRSAGGQPGMSERALP